MLNIGSFRLPRPEPSRSFSLLALAGVASLLIAGCGSSGGSDQLSLVAYSTPASAYAKIIPAFQTTADGRGWKFTQSYGASGDQSRAVLAGLPADVVALSLAPDVTKLVSVGLVSPTWNQDPYKGFVTNSVVAFTVRKGNPKRIHTWADLIRPGVQVVTPNPFTSGGARWNVMAAYGAQIIRGQSPSQALAYVKSLFGHVVAQDKSAREELQTFLAGKGDVAITYENEAIGAQKKGQPVDYVIPPQTIRIENPVAVVTRSKHVGEAQKFLDYLRSPVAQRVFVAQGYRSVLPMLADPKKFPDPAGTFTIDQLGGWKVVAKEFFDPQKGLIAGIEQGVGVSTAK
jgi:sulfate transport system substrate-binding protein